jgi:tetratricopeptide (TPR) repeat protein
VPRLRELCEQRPWLLLGCVAAAALGIRCAVLASFERSVYGAHLMPDEQVFDFYARALLDGQPLPELVGFNLHVPAHVFAAVYSVFGADPGSVRGLNVVLGTATCVVLFFLGASVRDRTTGILCALITALYGPFILASVTAHKTALELFLVAVAALFGVRSVVGQRPLDLALFAVALALGTHVRANLLALVLAAPIAFWIVWRKDRRAGQASSLWPKLASYALGLALVLVPLSRGGILGATEHGFNLYLANTLDNPSPYYQPARFAPAQPSFQGGGFVLKASLDVGRRLSPAEAREHYDAQLSAEWRGDPRAAAIKLWTKLAASIHVYEHAHNHNLAFIARFVPLLALPWLAFGLVFPLAVLGAVRGGRQHTDRWLLLMAGVYWLTLVVFFTEIRLRAPLALLLIPLAAIGLQVLLARRGRALAVAAIVLAAAAATTHLPVPFAGDLTTAHNLHALIHFEAGDHARAEEHYRAASKLEGLDSQTALLGLASIAVKRGELERARELLAQVSDDHYKVAEKHALLGNVALRQDRFAEAARSFERALEINPGIVAIYPILELVYQRTKQPHLATDVRRRHDYATSFFE